MQRAAAIILHAALGMTAGCPVAAHGIRWLPDHSGVDVTDVEKSRLPAADAPAERWEKVFPVRAAGANLPPMLGKWTVQGTALRFTPRFPFSPGMSYEATWQPAEGKAVHSRHTVPKAAAAPPAEVTHLFPGGDTVPENLLKFYLHFSAPMNGGGIYKFIHLRDDTGKEVELPFLEIDEELWDREHRRLTLFIDPGRIKREVKPLEDIGPALLAGKQFTLTIDAAWQDSKGRPMKAPAVKKFTVTGPDRTPPDPKSWQLTPAARGTRDPLRITFSEPMDHALALRLITVAGMPGQPSLNDEGTRWTFTPDQPWPDGPHRLVVEPELEDLAGNSAGKPFEVDIAGSTKDPATPRRPVEIPFP